MKRKPMIGVKFGKLKVLGIDHANKQGYYYICQCGCGEKIVARGTHLRNGHTKSCGCSTEDKWMKHQKQKRANRNNKFLEV